MNASDFEEELLTFINEWSAAISKNEQRIAGLQQTNGDLRNKVAAAKLMLEEHRKKHGLPSQRPPEEMEVVAGTYSGKTVKEILRQWAAEHDGDLVAKEVAKFLVSIGFFQDVTQAGKTLYREIGRMVKDGDLEKSSYGRYRLADARNTNARDEGQGRGDSEPPLPEDWMPHEMFDPDDAFERFSVTDPADEAALEVQRELASVLR
jgi:hypothetical protein